MINDNMTKDVIGPADFSQNLPPLVKFVLLIACLMEINPPLPSNSMPRISDTIFTCTCISYEEWQNDSQHKTELSSHSLIIIFYKTYITLSNSIYPADHIIYTCIISYYMRANQADCAQVRMKNTAAQCLYTLQLQPGFLATCLAA